jgi:hypothetical protein
VLSDWVELGLDPAQFWKLTPRMVLHIATAARHRLENEHNGRAWLAHTIEALHRQKRLQRLDTLTIKRRRTRDQTWQEQMQLCRMIAAAYGSKPING